MELRDQNQRRPLESFWDFNSMNLAKLVIMSFMFCYAFTHDFKELPEANVKVQESSSAKEVKLFGAASIFNADPLFQSFLKPRKLSKNEFLQKRLIRLLPRNIRGRAKYYLKSIIEVSEHYGIDPLWVISIVWTESHFKVHSRSHVGAQGLMQLMPRTQRYLEKKIKKKFVFSDSIIEIPLSREFHSIQLRNIEVGVHYLQKLLSRFSKRNLATVAYNMGPTWTRRRLNQKRPVGNRNHYLRKVSRSYRFISKRL